MKNKIENIQALRFFAAFSVIMVHLPLFQFGAWGVDIFFVVSGFIMSFVSEKKTDFFFIKRVIRIVPLYWGLTIIVFFIAIFKSELLNNTTANYEHLIKSLFFIPFDKNGIGHYPILFLGWSLNFEMLFYLIFYISILISKKFKEIICSFILIVIFLASNLLYEQNFLFEVFSNNIILEFIFGMMIFKVYKIYKKNINSIFFLITLSYIIIINISNYEFPRVFKFGVPAAIILYFFLFIIKKNFFSKKIVLLGDASYVLYLSHPYFIQFFYKIFQINENVISINILVSLIAIFFIFIFSILVYLYYEKPINYNLKKIFKIY